MSPRSKPEPLNGAPPAEVATEQEFDELPKNAVVIDGVAHIPDGDPIQRANFHAAVLRGTDADKRKAIETLGFGMTLSVSEEGKAPTSEKLDWLFGGLYSLYAERLGEERGLNSRLHSIQLGIPAETEDADAWHAAVGAQIAENLKARGFIQTESYYDAFRSVPRSWFLLEGNASAAYIDRPIGIGFGQTNSQPSTVAMTLEMLGPKPGERVLDIGSGSGWTTALLGNIVGRKGQVFGVEIRPELVELGNNNLKRAGITGNTEIRQAGEVLGLPEEGPFDRILVAAGDAGSSVPEALKRQLKVGGKMIVPVEGAILEVRKAGEDEYYLNRHEGYVFVPLIEPGAEIDDRVLHVAGRVTKRFGNTLYQMGYRPAFREGNHPAFDQSDRHDQVLQAAFEAYQADITIIIDDGPGRLERRVEMGAAIGAIIAGKDKEIYLVGKHAHTSEFARLEQVTTFKDTKAVLRRLHRQQQ